MKEYRTKIVHEKAGEPTTIVVEAGCTAVVFLPDGSLDLALLPGDAELEPMEDGSGVYINEGMMRFLCIMMATTDPDVRALVERKLDEGRTDSES